MIGVIAGTPVDTAFGITLVKQVSSQYISCAISQTPEEQTSFQVLPKAEKRQYVKQVLQDFRAQGVEQVLVYCNSLSSSVDFDALARELSLPIVTPLHFYRQLAVAYQSMGLLAANAQGSAGIERVITLHNPHSRVHAVSSLDWVEAVEERMAPQVLLESRGLKETIALFETFKVEAIIFGCTHFPYFLEAYQAATSLPCLSADAYFLEVLEANQRKNG